MRRIVVVGQRAVASPDFLLDDLAGTSGRLDVLVRCLRAALLVSHGLRTDTTAYLVLLGGPRAPRTLRVEGARAKFLRPDERSLATLVRKVLAVDPEQPDFVTVRPGIALANDGLAAVLSECRAVPSFVAEEGGEDARYAPLDSREGAYFFGDDLGFDTATRTSLANAGARPVGLGPMSLHAEDAIAVLANELDRRR
jgi:tRNA (pseudouridine54-N1)-methyltransferase